MGFWGYVDLTHRLAGTTSARGTSYSLVYADDQNHLATSKWRRCARAEDYTILWMLRGAVEGHQGAETDAVRNARGLLETLPGEVTGPWSPGSMRWADERDRSGTDEARERLLRALVELGAAR